MLKIGNPFYTCWGFDLLASLAKSSYLFIANEIMKQLAFLVISSIPNVQHIA
jgi:hypothetical protein